MTTSPASSGSSAFAQRVAANLEVLRARITSTGRDPATIRIVAVTKTFGVDAVLAALSLGLTAVGENYVDELCSKREAVGESVARWHYLGALQSNKIHQAVSCADVLCSVARLKEIEKIAACDREQRIYVQVDYTRAPSRNGAAPSEVATLVSRGRSLGLDVAGLMTVAPPDVEGTRAAFRSLTALADDLGLTERSMGMTDDLEVACELGTSELRIGRALFGAREVREAS
ncbi:MAG TPA: YggS family pyridoxal phosphate enzyme [Acidimicrobiales bacterium]